MKYLFSLCLLVAVTVVPAQHMFDYSDIRKGMFGARSVSGVRSMNDGEHYTAVKDGKIEKFTYKGGQPAGVVFDAAGFAELGGNFSSYAFSPDEKKILLSKNHKAIYRRSFTADYYVYDITANTLRKLTERGGEQVPAFSPDGTSIAFVRNNDIWLVSLGDYNITRVTDDGEFNKIINGHTDWVYEEEFEFVRAFAFSPDGSRLGYMRFDESQVPEFTITFFRDRLYTEPYTYKYPKAGDKNAVVELYVYEIGSGRRTRVDTGAQTDQYIPRIGWTPDGNFYFYRTNRHQNHFELLLSDAAGSGSVKVIYEERDKRYIERLNDETITFLPKGDRFIVKNETSGYTHLYMHTIGKGLTDTLTQGKWDVTELVGLSSDRVYYLSTETSALRRNLYSVKFNGKGKTRLTDEEGVYTIAPSKGFKYFISYFSNVSTPNLVRLHNGNGKVLRVLEDNAELKARLLEKRVPKKEFFQFKTERGTTLNGYMIRPANFDQDKKYPVLMTQYSGPGSQQVLDKFSMDWTDVMVQEGYIVVCVDGRGTGGRGTEFKKCTYANLGALEVEDQISAARYCATLPYVDPDRIGIYGWSYGGFMALNCILKGNDVFSTAIAVAPVTSWRFYDTIYTEIYNGLPQENPKGYDDNSPINHAEKLKGNLLLIHGTADDNVHVQNSYRMIDALVKAGKQFELMIYPDDNHGMVPTGRNHVMEKMIEYTLEKL